MYILGDIGNSETKIFLVDKKVKLFKKFTFLTKNINFKILNSKFKTLKNDFKNIQKILFCSVVPDTFNLVKKFFKKKIKVKCYEIKDLNLKSLINIKVNFKQVGSIE